MVRKRKIEGDKEVDLAALVDVLSNMLFFLLATVSFLQLKTLNAATPALSPAPSNDTTKVVSVSVEVKSTGYMLKAEGTASDPGFHPVSMEIPRINDAGRCTTAKLTSPCLDTKRLSDELFEIKKFTPETKNIMIFPEQGTVFQDIVVTMDASREMPSRVRANTKVPLFTRPVLSELVDGNEVQRDDIK